jgi:hypothetical protein
MDFEVHERLICGHSKYFATAFQKEKFKKGEQRLVELPEVSEITFRFFLHWLYAQVSRLVLLSPCATAKFALRTFEYENSTGKSLKEKREQSDSDESYVAEDNSDKYNSGGYAVKFSGALENFSDSVYDCLLDLAIFADSQDTRILRNDVIDAMRYYYMETGNTPGFKHVITAYDKLAQNSNLKKWITSITVFAWNPKEHPIPDNLKLPQEYFESLMTEYAYGRTQDSVHDRWVQHCAFHEHDSKEERETCKVQRKMSRPYIYSLLSTVIEAVEKEKGPVTSMKSPKTASPKRKKAKRK